MTEKKLWNVALDEPFGDHNPDEHDRDSIYLVWLSDDDLGELVKRTKGKVSYWEAGISDLDAIMEVWHEWGLDEYEP